MAPMRHSRSMILTCDDADDRTRCLSAKSRHEIEREWRLARDTLDDPMTEPAVSRYVPEL